MDGTLRILRWALIVGGVGFAAGFFGPMFLAPGANQGPMLGIFITGPLGLVAGAGYGAWREWRGAGSGERGAVTAALRPLLRPVAGFAAGVLLLNGMSGVAAGQGRGAAAALVLAGVLGWWAWTGRWPGWWKK
ncbi:MAG TPA: hypothetical protein VJ773_02850 [Gemmatimonadales bacterium]|nr:hypothetical protein [Gemmatimonadales bacterium]